MLCEVHLLGNIFTTYIFLTILAVISTFLLSTIVFKKYYMNVTYEIWQNKSNPEFPSPTKVKKEILQMFKGCYTATIPPTLALYFTQHGYSQSYCGLEDYGWGYLIFSGIFAILGSDFIEFYYHRFGHLSKIGWQNHKWHHVFNNPTPFAVIADEYVDQFFRALPILLFTMIMPMNIDMIFFIYGVFFYAYGVYLHWGYELECISAHNPYFNTAFQHYIHHAKSTINKPYHTGFFFKIWDNIFGSVWDEECVCVQCEKKKGNRSLEKFKKIQIPDYTILLDYKFWIKGDEKVQKKSMEPKST